MPGESGVVQSGKAHTAWEAGQESAFCFSKAQLIHTQDGRCLVCGGEWAAEGFFYLGFDR